MNSADIAAKYQKTYFMPLERNHLDSLTNPL